MEPYFTLVIPYVALSVRTEWHPTEPTGPFKTLTRGNFKTELEAIEWAQKKLNGTPYTVQLVQILTDDQLIERCAMCGETRGVHSLDGSWTNGGNPHFFISYRSAKGF